MTSTPSNDNTTPRRYQPRPGSKVEAAVNYVRQKGSARSRELACVMDVEVTDLKRPAWARLARQPSV